MSTWPAEVLEGRGKEYDDGLNDLQALVSDQETSAVSGIEGDVCKGERTMRLVWTATEPFYIGGKPCRCALDDATQEMTDRHERKCLVL